MWTDLKDLFRWFCNRDSDSAAIVCIIVASTMTQKDLLQMRDYFQELHKSNEMRENSER